MARLGFKKIYPPGGFDRAAVQALFAHIKTCASDAGFSLLLDTSTSIDVIQSGALAGTATDDVPHWAFRYQDSGADGAVVVHTVYGQNYLDAGAYTHSLTLVNSGWADESNALTLWFAMDGAAGWWWLHAVQPDSNSSTGITTRFAYAGSTSRRYPSDTHQGLCARYGIWDAWGSWHPAYAKTTSGSINTNPRTNTWSPFGEGWAFSSERHVGSPLPKMAVPQFPNKDNSISACVLGEFNEILILTDGYAAEEIVAPGWVAMTGGDYDQPYAVPAPASFTLL